MFNRRYRALSGAFYWIWIRLWKLFKRILVFVFRGRIIFLLIILGIGFVFIETFLVAKNQETEVLVEHFDVEYALDNKGKMFFKFDDGQFNCSQIPLPQLFFYDDNDSEEVIDLVERRNLIEIWNYRTTLGLCEVQCRNKLLPHELKDNTVRVAMGDRNDYYHYYIEIPVPTLEELTSTCEINIKVIDDRSKADINIFGSILYARKYSLKYDKKDKMVTFFRKETLFRNEDSSVEKTLRDIEPIHSYLHQHPLSTEFVFYDSFDHYTTFYPSMMRNFPDYFPENKEKYREKLMEKMNQKSLVFLAGSFVSSCYYNKNDRSSFKRQKYYRSAYLRELEKHIKIASFGQCGESKFHGGLFHTKETINITGRILVKLQLFNWVHFGLCFDNSIRYGYVSEKLYECLYNPFHVPVYMGAPNIYAFFDKEIISKYKVFVFANQYPNPKDLADYLNYLVSNRTAYMEYFQWRLDGVKLIPSRYVDSKGTLPIFQKKEENMHYLCRLARVFKNGKKLCE